MRSRTRSPGSPRARGLGALLVAAFLSEVALVAPAGAQEVVYSGSFQYATGTYLFTERTNSAYFLNGLAVQAGALRVSANLPVIYQSTPWVSYTTGGGVPTGGPQQGEVQDSLGGRMGGPLALGSYARGMNAPAASGIGAATSPRSMPAPTAMSRRFTLPDTASFDQVGVGDPTFRVDVDLVRPGRSDVTVTLSGQVKAPVADPERGFGTGEWDGGGALSVAGRVGGSVLLFGEVGYWVLGDMPELELQDPVSYSVGIGHALGDGRVSLLASLSGYSRILADTDPPLDVGGAIGYRIAEGRSLNLGLTIGLSESSPDFAVSAGWRTRL